MVASLRQQVRDHPCGVWYSTNHTDCYYPSAYSGGGVSRCVQRFYAAEAAR
jgi:hypothetical protein